MKMYLKIFLGTGLPFGLFTGVQEGLSTDFGNGLRTGIFMGLFFGFFMSLILGELNDLSLTLKEFSTREMANSSYISPNQSIAIELGCNLDLAFDRCIQALNQFGAKIKSQNKQSFEIKATSRMTWKSFGEVLTIRLSDLGNQKVKIEISSSPKLKITLLDYGQGRENVEKIAKILTT